MSKSSTVFSNPAFQKKNEPAGFNLVTQNNFNTLIPYQPLDNEDSQKIEKLVWENQEPGHLSEEQTEKDLKEIKLLTAEIKSIGKQGILLLGERVWKAREILKNYRNGTFTQWIEAAFESKKTGYNVLAYYELFHALPLAGLKEKFKKIPQRAAYILASRHGNLEKKMTIISDHADLKANDLIELIQEQFPMAARDKRTSSTNTRLIHSLYEGLKKIQKRKRTLTEEDIVSLKNLRKMLDMTIGN